MIMDGGKIVRDMSKTKLDARDESLEQLFFETTKRAAVTET